MRHTESKLQCNCVRWFRLQYAEYALLLNSVPNGLLTSATQARIAVGEGLTKGVADLELNIARGGYHGLKIEMKQGTTIYKAGKAVNTRTYQRPEQRAWQAAVEAQGYKYIVVRTFEEFVSEVEKYIEQN